MGGAVAPLPIAQHRRAVPGRSGRGSARRPTSRRKLKTGGWLMQTRNTPLLPGTLWGLAAVLIWAGWWVLTRASVSGNLQAADLAALRFGLAGLVMLPMFVRNRAAIARVPKKLLF